MWFGITRQMHSGSQNLRRSCFAMQLLAAGDLRRYLCQDKIELNKRIFQALSIFLTAYLTLYIVVFLIIDALNAGFSGVFRWLILSVAVVLSAWFSIYSGINNSGLLVERLL